MLNIVSAMEDVSMGKRVFLIVLDSLGAGEMPDAQKFGDEGSNTLLGISTSENFVIPNLKKSGLFNVEGIRDVFPKNFYTGKPEAAHGRMAEKSNGKDTTTGHWEIAGIISTKPMPTFPNGFPPDVINEFEKRTGLKSLCNLPFSGTEVIEKYGCEHMETKALIVYTSADSVFQIAAHEDVIPIDDLYGYCEIARSILTGEYAVGRVIARPFEGNPGDFRRTANRKDFSLAPPKKTMLNYLKDSGYKVVSIGKINDIFAGSGITEKVISKSNNQGVEKIMGEMKKDFEGLVFLNLVDFDMLYGHRNNIDGYAKALAEFDKALPWIRSMLKEEDILIITADHGCDPSTLSTDHSREYVPLLVYGDKIKNINLGTRNGFSDIAAFVLQYFNVTGDIEGKSFLDEIILR